MTRNIISTSLPPKVYNEIKQRHLKFSELLVKGFYAHLREIDQPAEGDKDWEIAKRERAIIRLTQALSELNIQISQQKTEIDGLLNEISRLKGTNGDVAPNS